MYYLLILKSDIMIKKFTLNMSKLLCLTLKFFVFKTKVKIILSSDGLTIDIQEKKSIKK